ncbi:MAG: hypothetical protein L6Q73_06715 [Aquabacterium sp.]|nr:hypothetical protein [Aquabacterium sp.]
MGVRLLSFVVWALAAGGAAFWALRLGAPVTPVPAHAARAVADASVPPADLARLFGVPPAAAPVEPSAPPPPSASSRFKLIGVIAPRAGGPQGLALLAVDGGPPRAYRIAARVANDWVVRSVGHRRVELAPAAGGPAVVLELPLLAEASRGALPPAGPQVAQAARAGGLPGGPAAVMPPGHRVAPLRAPVGAAAAPPSVAGPSPTPTADERPVQPGVESQ